MKKRLTDVRRAALESRFKQLKQVRAYLEPGKAANIVDGVSPEDANIQNVVQRLMALMQAEDGAGKYRLASKKLEALVRKAFDESPAPSPFPAPATPPAPFPAPLHNEGPAEESNDLQNPMLRPVEELEQEVQGLDDASLMQEVEQLEQDLKDAIFSGHDAPGAPAPGVPAPGGAPAPSPKPSPVSAPPKEEAESDEPEEKEEEKAPELSPENKLALLMTLPKSKRLEKAANLRALANALELAEHNVSSNNTINEQDNSALKDDYEDQGEGSMKDTGTKTAALKATLRQLIAASEEVEKDEEKEDEDDDKKTAVLKLALRHLLASIEDIEKESKEDEDESPADSEEVEKEEKDEEPSFEEKKAILQARLALLRKTATVDGKTMKTPSEVPSPSGTTEDNLKGDAKIQYSTATGDTHLSEVQERRQKLPTDKSIAGNEEPNAVYSANKPSSPTEWATSEKDSSKDVNNKRVLKDEGTAVQTSTPSSPTEQLESGAGSHQKTKDWEKAKSESDTSPSGDRLVGLAELVKERTGRAMKLASKMASQGLIKTEAQLEEQVVKFATMEDDVFEKVAEFFESTLTSKAGEIPEAFKKNVKESGDESKKESKDEYDDEEEDEKPVKEARSIRRKASPDEDRNSGTIRRASSESNGLSRALNLVGSGDDIPFARGSAISGKLNGLGWSNPITKIAELNDVDAIYKGTSNGGLI